MQLTSSTILGILLIFIGLGGIFTRKLIYQTRTTDPHSERPRSRRGEQSVGGDGAVLGGALMVAGGLILVFFPSLPNQAVALLDSIFNVSLIPK